MREFLGSPEMTNPEDVFVAAVASCHMLTFLAIAARKRIEIDAYEDNAIGFMNKNEEGKLAVTKIILRPSVSFGGSKTLTSSEVGRLHTMAHDQCFIANSVRTSIA